MNHILFDHSAKQSPAHDIAHEPIYDHEKWSDDMTRFFGYEHLEARPVADTGPLAPQQEAIGVKRRNNFLTMC